MKHHEFDLLLRRNGIFVEAQKWELLSTYVDLLLAWNRQVNLISRRDEENIWTAHIIHSIVPLFLLEIPTGIRALDLGTGGGLPGIPLAIIHGEVQTTLLDSIQKKIRAVTSILHELRLPNVTALAARAEDLGNTRDHTGAYDLVLARGVAPLHELVGWTRPLLAHRVLGPTVRRHFVPDARNEFRFPYLLAYKGGILEAEIQRVAVRFPDVAITEIPVHFSGAEHLRLEEKKLVVVEFP
ncbi:MAG: Ribosomal RNA small subunit methyltransferase G [Syntrophorhabdus sp. PtaU1.Bin153]|nr:MAG: Ribosomal RNA small subunit methyltransferase G [Syntrophorhabdus sp. PtaU1.Bin153]